MTAPRPKPDRWVVRCDAYTTQPYSTREAAERRAASVTAARHCPLVHTVEQVNPERQR